MRTVFDSALAASEAPVNAGRLPAFAALSVHRNTVADALRNTLALSYPTVLTLVGEESFSAMATAYAVGRRPQSSRLDAFAEELPGFLMHYVPVSNLDYLPEIAQLDRAVARALTQPDETHRRLFTLDVGVELSVPESLTVLTTRYPVATIRAALTDEDDAALRALDMTPGVYHAAIWRRGRQAVVRGLSPAAGVFLTGVLDGTAAAEALETAVTRAELEAVLAAIQGEVFAGPFARIVTHSAEEGLP